MHKNDRISVIWLDPGEVKSDFAVSVMDLFLAFPGRLTGRVVVRSGGAITGARNRSIDTFLTQTDDEWALLLDADMSFTPDALATLIEVAERKTRPIVGGLCFVHMAETAGAFTLLQPTIYNRSAHRAEGFDPNYTYPQDSLVKCDATGAAFLLVHREVFEKIAADRGLGPWSWFSEGPAADLASWLGEDISFCNAATASGFPIYVHTGAKVDHLKGINYTLTEQMYRMLMASVTFVTEETANADA